MTSGHLSCSRSSVSSIIKEINWSKSLDHRSYILGPTVYYHGWDGVRYLAGLPHLPQKRARARVGHGEHDGIRVSSVFRVFERNVLRHTVSVGVPTDVSSVLTNSRVGPEARLASVDIATNNTRSHVVCTSSRVARSLLRNVAIREKTARQVR